MKNSGGSGRSEMIADLAALIVMLIFLAAFIVGIFDRTYQMPTGLNLIVGLAATFIFGQRVARGGKNENEKSSTSIKPDSSSYDIGDASDMGDKRAGSTDAAAYSQDMAHDSNSHGSIQRRSDAADDSSFHEGAD